MSANCITSPNGVTHNGHTSPAPKSSQAPLNRADELADLLNAVQDLIIPFVRSADKDAATKSTGHSSDDSGALRPNLVEFHKPEELRRLLNFNLPEGKGRGKDGLLEILPKLLQYSVNTWDQGFLDKLYASTNAVGVISELILAVLNTNLHVYHVSPALTVIEKTTCKTFAGLYGFTGPFAGGVSTQGGSASNLTSMIIARNSLFPDTKENGNGSYKFVVFTSDHGHYSLEKAAQAIGIGSSSVWAIPVDSKGCVLPLELEKLIQKAKLEGRTPFYVNATAGTTVLGSYDPFIAISEVCKKYGLWFHIDGSWGGPAIFSSKQNHKLSGSHLADSIAVNPHKMLGTPVTCSFLLGPDLRIFHNANTLPAGYLFHETSGEEVWDLADLTLQCGRRGDSLKLALSWLYYGAEGYEQQIDNAFEMAAYMAAILEQDEDFVLVSENPPPCLQICFYHAPKGELSQGNDSNTAKTRRIAEELALRGFMVDYAPGPNGSFFRVVVNVQTRKETVDGLITAISECAK